MTATRTPRTPSPLGRRLAEAMRNLELTPRELDKLSGVAAETIRALTRGKTRAMMDANLVAIAKALDAHSGRTDYLQILKGKS